MNDVPFLVRFSRRPRRIAQAPMPTRRGVNNRGRARDLDRSTLPTTTTEVDRETTDDK
jgi:hypothetical protein